MFRLIPLATLALTVACADDAPVSPAQPLPPLQTAVWHVHTSDGQAVPALLGHRGLAGNVLEQDFLDSARVEIDTNGTWQLLGWYQRFRNQEHYAWGSTLDWGTWTATTTGYEFRRNTGELLYTLIGAVGDELQLNLRYPGQSGVAVSVLRRTPPATASSRDTSSSTPPSSSSTPTTAISSASSTRSGKDRRTAPSGNRSPARSWSRTSARGPATA